MEDRTKGTFTSGFYIHARNLEKQHKHYGLYAVIDVHSTITLFNYTESIFLKRNCSWISGRCTTNKRSDAFPFALSDMEGEKRRNNQVYDNFFHHLAFLFY